MIVVAKRLEVMGQIIFLYFWVKHPVAAHYQKAQNSVVNIVVGVGDGRDTSS